MKFVVNRDVFSDAVSFVVKLLPQRPTLPILSGVVLEASDGALTLSSFDYEVSSRTTVEAEVETAGAVLVQGRLLADIANRLPQAPVEVTREDNAVTIRCGQASFNLPTMPLEEFPTLPEVSGVSGTVEADAFAEAVSQVAVAASKEDVAPVITGVNLTLDADSLGLVATDRYRVAVRRLEWQSEFTETRTALVPSRTLAEAAKSLGHSGTIRITLVEQGERELIAFSANDKTVTSLLIKGNFPAVERLFPAETPHYAVLAASDVVEAVRRVQLVLEREAALRFTFGVDGLMLEAAGSEQAQASEQIDVVLTGDDVVVSLKPQFLLDGVGAIHSPFVRIAFTKTDNPGKPGPVLLTSQTSKDEGTSDDSFRYLLQPNLLMR
ncbi:DNA polymerase III subunit beta [Pseudoclavibacter chungangensis]|uniref:Beta sliding clamp n=1 Tax=Pseudoclavibacter chungangensis TaxID=587635 RepID=A0A7J5BS67_9MICO|nr:DNA polymerase III subunit beta [Pseudoclavibacter chungangensis]KAB1655382.1 DNA polymerase III subunit beta [Pseudoclavibacter chungangensis]NYJ68334.1 DNA polymerase-3 subunit beta [Pseudoclavibacter chungangensis]